jgi:hypothetical protein
VVTQSLRLDGMLEEPVEVWLFPLDEPGVCHARGNVCVHLQAMHMYDPS